jgi:DnaJ-class molecular chaperone
LIEITSNNEDEVREEWEKIQMAYTILVDDKTRKRYDRSELNADPGAAMLRSAMEATVHGVTSIDKGLFRLGQMTVE